jgi:hypothetical protein
MLSIYVINDLLSEEQKRLVILFKWIELPRELVFYTVEATYRDVITDYVINRLK